MDMNLLRTVVEDALKKQNDAMIEKAYEHALMSMKNDKSYLEDEEQFEVTDMYVGAVERELVNRNLRTWAQIEEDEEELTM